MKNFLGIDTSNYTTSVGVFGEDNINLKKLLPVKLGDLGLRQSDAIFHHTKQIPDLIEELFSRVDINSISGIGVSNAPRRAEGSYMPCFLVGISVAKALAAANKIPLYYFSHQQGHIAAAAYSCGKMDLLKEKHIAFHISGGTTEALLITPYEDGTPCCEIIGGSNDLKAGQAIDRVGTALGLSFPCGRELDELSLNSTAKFKPKPSVKDTEFSLSGIENKCKDMIKKGDINEDIALFAMQSILVNIDGCIKNIFEKHGEFPVLFSGGVSSNTILREYFSKKYGAYFARPEFSSDNAFGTAILASRANNFQ